MTTDRRTTRELVLYLAESCPVDGNFEHREAYQRALDELKRREYGTPPMRIMTHTRTYVIMELSKGAYEEIRSKLEDAGYDQAFHEHDGRQCLDMHGIAVSEETT